VELYDTTKSEQHPNEARHKEMPEMYHPEKSNHEHSISIDFVGTSILDTSSGYWITS
jgi:hypothetical protein